MPLEDFIISVFCCVDELLKEVVRGRRLRGRGFAPKLSDGEVLQGCSMLRGSSSDQGRNIAVDEAGNAYVTGQITSPNFPTMPGAFQPANAGGFSDAFVAKIGD